MVEFIDFSFTAICSITHQRLCLHFRRTETLESPISIDRNSKMDLLNMTTSTVASDLLGFPQAAKYDYTNISNHYTLDELPWNANMVSTHS